MKIKRQNGNDDSFTVYIVRTRTYYKSPPLLIGSILTIFEINNVIMKIWMKSKLNSEKFWKIQKKIVKRYEKYGSKVG